jgi:hypothetical protein
MAAVPGRMFDLSGTPRSSIRHSGEMPESRVSDVRLPWAPGFAGRRVLPEE